MLGEVNAALLRAHSGGVLELHEFSDAFKRYAHSQFAHMTREETILFPSARQVLVDTDWQEVDAAFRVNLDPLFGTRQDKQYAGIFQLATDSVR
jgi:hemerythrin-like domain-containing protein